MKMLKELVNELKNNELWLMERILSYASKHDYTKYTSTLTAAWKASIEGLTSSLEKYSEEDRVPIDSNFEKQKQDPSTSFGKIEAIRHRDRGVGISLFMGLFKYYRQTYLDCINEILDKKYQSYLPEVNTFFDKIEISYVNEWVSRGENDYRDSLLMENVYLTNEKNKFLTIFESLYEPVFIIDENDKIVNANYRAALLHNKETVPGGDYYHQYDVELPEYLHGAVREALESEEDIFTRTLEFEINGECYYYDLLFTKLLDISSKFKGLCMVINDNTKLKTIEKELLKKQDELMVLNNSLTERVKTETQKRLHNERLLIDQKKSADMGNMVNAIAHQWKQPLNTLSLQIQYVFGAMRENHPYEDICEYEDKMSQLLEYMSNTIDDFRNFMTPDKVKAVFSVKQCLIDSLAIVDAQLKNNSIEYDIQYEGEHFNTYGSMSELKQVLLNIIVNSKEALDGISLEKKQIDIKIIQNDPEIIITIADNGGGIHPKVIKKLFFPYYTTKSKGTGIGLYMSKLIIQDSFDGQIKIENIEGGAVTTITLPKQAPPIE